MKITKENIDDLDVSELDLYGTYKLIEKLTTVRKETRSFSGYTKFVGTGKIGFSDYQRGFLCFSVRVQKRYRIKNQKPDYTVRISFWTVDDGDYGGETAYMTYEEACKLVERIKTDILEDLQVLPTLEEFNLTLRPYGIQVGYE